MLIRAQRHQHAPKEDIPNCWALNLLRHLDELGMKIALIPTPLSVDPPKAHNIEDYLAVIARDQQKILTAIGI